MAEQKIQRYVSTGIVPHNGKLFYEVYDRKTDKTTVMSASEYEMISEETIDKEEIFKNK